MKKTLKSKNFQFSADIDSFQSFSTFVLDCTSHKKVLLKSKFLCSLGLKILMQCKNCNKCTTNLELYIFSQKILVLVYCA